MSIYGICEKCGDETKDYICSSCLIDEIDHMKIENERLLRGDLTMSDKLVVTKHEDVTKLYKQVQELQRRVEELEHRNEKPKRSSIQTSTYEIEALESKCHELIGEIALKNVEIERLKKLADEEMERCIKIVHNKEGWISKKWIQTIENEIRQR